MSTLLHLWLLKRPVQHEFRVISDTAENKRCVTDVSQPFLLILKTAQDPQTIFMFSLRQANGSDSVAETLSENAHLRLK